MPHVRTTASPSNAVRYVARGKAPRAVQDHKYFDVIRSVKHGTVTAPGNAHADKKVCGVVIAGTNAGFSLAVWPITAYVIRYPAIDKHQRNATRVEIIEAHKGVALHSFG